jgi:transposase
MELKRVGLDTSKAVFTVHGVDHGERVVVRRDLKRSALEGFFAKLAPTVVALEACGASHHWGRRLAALGHEVRLIPPQYVKPFVKRAKNDRNDAEAISEAASRPGMATVAVKSAERQAEAMVLAMRETLVKQRTQWVNTIRGHAAEFGVIAGRGIGRVDEVLERVMADASIPPAAQEMLRFAAAEVAHLDGRIAELERRMQQQHKANPMSQMLAKVPGIGPIGALSLALTVDAERFQSGRHFAAWLGLVPKQHSTGGRQQLGSISKAGNERLRQLLVVGAMSVIRFAKPGSKSASAWLLQLLERKPRKLAAVALANKMARILWAMMTSGEAYRPQAVAS